MGDQYPLPISSRYVPGLKLYHDAEDYKAKEGQYPPEFDLSKSVKRWSTPGTSFHVPNSEAPGGLVAISVDGPALNLPGPRIYDKPPYVAPTTRGTYQAGGGSQGFVPPSVMASTADVKLLVSRLGSDATYGDQDVVDSSGVPVKITYSDDLAKYYFIRYGTMVIPAVRLVQQMYAHGVNDPGKYTLVNGALVVFPTPPEPVAGGPPEVPIPVQLQPGEVLHFGFGAIPRVYAADQVPNSGGPETTPPSAGTDISATLFQIQQTLNQVLGLLLAKGTQ